MFEVELLQSSSLNSLLPTINFSRQKSLSGSVTDMYCNLNFYAEIVIRKNTKCSEWRMISFFIFLHHEFNYFLHEFTVVNTAIPIKTGSRERLTWNCTIPFTKTDIWSLIPKTDIWSLIPLLDRTTFIGFTPGYTHWNSSPTNLRLKITPMKHLWKFEQKLPTSRCPPPPPPPYLLIGVHRCSTVVWRILFWRVQQIVFVLCVCVFVCLFLLFEEEKKTSTKGQCLFRRWLVEWFHLCSPFGLKGWRRISLVFMSRILPLNYYEFNGYQRVKSVWKGYLCTKLTTTSKGLVQLACTIVAPTGKVSLKGVFVYQTDYHLKRLGTACMHHCSSNG